MAKMNYERLNIETRDAKQPRTYKPFRPNRPKKHKQKQQKQKAPPPPAPDPIPTCPKCESPMVRRTSEFGPFWGCHQYPRCRGTRK